MKTVEVIDTKETWFGGKVVIDEIREYGDSRGSVAEVWREDDDIMGSNSNKPSMMCYTSVNKPYVMRGPHQHSPAQCDFFYTFKNRMSYHLFDPETGEMKIYITDPNKITRVKVDSPIVHSYRNLEDHCINTSNYPTSLFMGKDKKWNIDEIRWEHKYSKKQTFVIIGAGGRLGEAITNELYENMGTHDYHVIPIYKKLHNNDDVNQMFMDIDNALIDIGTKKIESEKVTIINCAAYANVQNSENDDVKQYIEWSNVKLPLSLCKMSVQRDWFLVQFSSDYVYQTLKKDSSIFSSLGEYTRSKKRMEYEFRQSPDSMVRNTTIFRVANLFSINDGKRHNMIKKFDYIKRYKRRFSIDANVEVFPTDAESLAKSLIENIKSGYEDKDKNDTKVSLKFFNVVPNCSYSIKDFIEKYFDVTEFDVYENDIEPWGEKFKNGINSDGVIYITTNEQSILDIIKRGRKNVGIT